MSGGTPDDGLRVTDLSVRFSRWGQEVDAVKDVSFTARTGEWVAVVGHNGSGKSTLLRAIAGYVEPLSGAVEFDGLPLRGLTPAQRSRRLFFVHQNPLLGSAPLLSALENLQVATTHIRPRLPISTLRDALISVGLGTRIHQPVTLLSGGERQLLALLVARLRTPRLLLLDEAFSALDPVREAAALDIISAMQAQGALILQVTHHLAAVIDRTTRVLRMAEGRLTTDDDRPDPFRGRTRAEASS